MTNVTKYGHNNCCDTINATTQYYLLHYCGESSMTLHACLTKPNQTRADRPGNRHDPRQSDADSQESDTFPKLLHITNTFSQLPRRLDTVLQLPEVTISITQLPRRADTFLLLPQGTETFLQLPRRADTVLQLPRRADTFTQVL